VWDKVSPINNVPADYFLAREDVDQNAEIYLIKDAVTGSTLYFQPHVAGIEGLSRMDSQTVILHAKEHKASIAQSRADNRVVEAVFKDMGI
jgi:hypothetical protein